MLIPRIANVDITDGDLPNSTQSGGTKVRRILVVKAFYKNIVDQQSRQPRPFIHEWKFHVCESNFKNIKIKLLKSFVLQVYGMSNLPCGYNLTTNIIWTHTLYTMYLYIAMIGRKVSQLTFSGGGISGCSTENITNPAQGTWIKLQPHTYQMQCWKCGSQLNLNINIPLIHINAPHNQNHKMKCL